MKCEIFLNANDGITDFRDDDNSSAVFKFKAKAASWTQNNGTKIVKIRELWRTLFGKLLKFH